MINDVILSKEKIIEIKNGNVKHILKNDSDGFVGFGEAYFSEVNYGSIKAWKKHQKMTLNLIVPYGRVHFAIYDNRNSKKTYGEYILSSECYQRLTIPPNLWFGFKGLHKKKSIILNIANILHNDHEVEKLSINEINYDWEKIE
jgi:dTDP-4-dehydrorhamnose 3,5-epimerase